MKDAVDPANASYGSAEGGVFVQRQMCAGPVVIVGIRGQRSAQMRLVEGDQVVDAFAADRFDNSFGMGVLSGTAWCNRSIADAHGTKAQSLATTPRRLLKAWHYSLPLGAGQV